MDQFLKEVEELVGVTEKSKDDDVEVHPYAHLEKSKVLQSARIFHDDKLVREKPRKCCTIIAQILYLHNNALNSKDISTNSNSANYNALTPTEATELFFSATKLFVSPDPCLRRIVYLFLKEIQPLCDPSDVIIVTSCLTKDMTCDIPLYRANAIRVLVNIIDSAMLGAIERYMKQAIVDKDAMVRNAALVASSHLFEMCGDNATIVRRWIGEVQEAMMKQTNGNQRRGKENDMVQTNAIRLLCQMKGHDRLGMAKLVQQYASKAGKGGFRSPMALVILIRACGRSLSDAMSISGESSDHRDIREISPLCREGFDFLETSLSHPSSMVAYEAARTICTLPNMETRTHNLTKAVDYIHNMLSSKIPSERFAAVRTLAEVANWHPRSAARCNEGLEGILDDENSHLATLAVTTLLKTGNEESIDRLVRNISTLIISAPDEYKITIVRSLQRLCLKYPSKHRVIVSFLSEFLREEGGFGFKQAIVQSIVSLMKLVPETTESSLFHLCEFVEDCEYTQLSTATLYVIAELGPKTLRPSRYIRYLFNRVILENAVIRAAAVSALAKFAASCPSLRVSIVALLKQSKWDEDDEVRDRAMAAVRVLEEAMEMNPYVSPDIDLDHVMNEEEVIQLDIPVQGDLAMLVYGNPSPIPFHKLERSIKAYAATPGKMNNASEVLTFAELPTVDDAVESTDTNAIDHSTINATSQIGLGPAPMEIIEPKIRPDPAAAIYAIPELASLGKVFKSSSPVPLTEDETEYVVRCVKHILDNHVVLQFIIENTVENQRLDNVVVSIESDSELYEIIGDVPVDHIRYGTTGNCFAVLQRNVEETIESVEFTCQLNFTVVPIDPGTDDPSAGEYKEEYPLEGIVIASSDFMAKFPAADFRQAWNESNNDNEVLDTFSLQFRDLDVVVPAVVDFLGMTPCDGTGQLPVNVSGLTQHMLHLSGKFVSGDIVLVRAQLTMQAGSTSLKVAIRSENADVSRVIANCIR
mmetsp:Transcript_677/g.1437  ORF Transcript_677/g.1437 Transcript_677/m.1437 type:complete len:984 (-) Transcript_677:33-2984(-)